MISKIERFSVHDGPGIRTLVVLKGCPLKCLWCSSPYTQNPGQELLYVKRNCQGCGICIPSCPQKAIAMDADNKYVKTDRSVCTGCGNCVSVCPNGAREISGRHYTSEELLHELEKDAVFFRRSGGGVTIGGGEPTMQAEFVRDILFRCRRLHIHTAMETSGFTSWTKFSSILEHLDLLYMDIKHMEEKKHIEITGVSNRLILQNARNASEHNEIILRLPVIPGLNDSEKNILKTASFARSLGKNILRLELLPYHQFGEHGYDELERTYTLEKIKEPPDEHMKRLQEIARTADIEVAVGG